MPGHSGGDLVAFHHGVLDNAREIGEHVMHHGHPVHDSLAARTLSRHRIVVDNVFSDQALKPVLIGGDDRLDDRFIELSQTPLAHPHIVPPLPTAHQPHHQRLRISRARRGYWTVGDPDSSVTGESSHCPGWTTDLSSRASCCPVEIAGPT